MSFHAAVWIDHNEAKIFHVGAEDFEKTVVHAPHKHVQRRDGHSVGSANDAGVQHFFHAVAEALKGSEEILVVGPAATKLAFIKHVHKHDHALEPKIVGVETVDHPTDGQLVKFVRSYFKKTDQMRGIGVPTP
jgi:stalled ribosome rescue protein Dom34